MIRVTCPKCQKKLSLDDAMAGGVGACPGCHAKFRVPKPAAQPSAAAKTGDPKKPAAPVKEVGIRAVSKPSPEAKARPEPPVKESAIKPAPTYKPQMDDEDSTPYLVVSDPVPPPEPKRKRRKLDDQEIEEIGVDKQYLKNRKKKKKADADVGMVAVVWTCVAMLLCWVALGILTWLKPEAGIVMFGFGMLALLIGDIWLVVVAFQESAMWGLLCLFVPFAALVFVAMYYQRALEPFLVQVAGGLIAASALLVVGMKVLSNLPGQNSAQPAATQPATP